MHVCITSIQLSVLGTQANLIPKRLFCRRQWLLIGVGVQRAGSADVAVIALLNEVKSGSRS